MIPDLGKYAFSVLGSYAAFFLILGVLIASTLWRGCRICRELSEIENQRCRNDG